MMRPLGVSLLLLAACADAPPPPAVVGSVPPPPPSRFDGTYRGMATRSFGTANDCGRPSGQLYMILAQGRAVIAQPAVGMAQHSLQQGLRLGLFGIAEGGFQAIGGLGQGAAEQLRQGEPPFGGIPIAIHEKPQQGHGPVSLGLIAKQPFLREQLQAAEQGFQKRPEQHHAGAIDHQLVVNVALGVGELPWGLLGR